MQKIKLIVRGRVQGVAFRHHTKLKADEIGVHGTVMNKPDGSVHITAFAEKAKIKTFISWCHKGSPASTVKNIEIIRIEHTTIMNHSFDIIR